QPRLTERRLSPLRAADRRAELGGAPGRRDGRRRRLHGARPRPRADRPRPLRLDRGAVRRRTEPAQRVRPAPPPLADSGHRARAERRLRRRRRDRVPAARGSPSRAVGAQARSVRVEAGEPLRRQHRNRLDAAASRQHAALLQRGRDRGGARHRVAAVSVPRPGANHRVRRRNRRVREGHRAHRERGDRTAMTRAVALIDGEHLAAVVRDALRQLPYEWEGAILVGGTEKLRGDDEYGVALIDDFGDGEIVVDLSDDPVLGPLERMRWISRALAAGLPYIGAGFRFDPPELSAFELPSISVVGTGKRVGKTAVTARLARLLSRDHDVVVVTMGRGGPPEPELVETPPTLEDLVGRSRAGEHAASDHLEIA